MRVRYLLTLFIGSVLMLSCTDDGGKLTEIDLVVRDAQNNERLGDVTVRLMQGGAGGFMSSFEGRASKILFKTDNLGVLNKFYFSNELTSTRLVVGVLPDTMSSCYPRIRLQEGEKNTIHFNALPQTASLRIDFSTYNHRTNSQPIDLNIVHIPEIEEPERYCDAMVLVDTLTPSDFPVLETKIYAFGRYRIRGRTLQDPWESFEIEVTPNQQEPVFEVIVD